MTNFRNCSSSLFYLVDEKGILKNYIFILFLNNLGNATIGYS